MPLSVRDGISILMLIRVATRRPRPLLGMWSFCFYHLNEHENKNWRSYYVKY